MRIELISTGDEVITGNIDDTNASYLSRELFESGLQVDRRHTAGDSLEELMAMFTEISERECIAIETGGMGPTTDDLTTEAIARVAGKSLVLNEEWHRSMSQWFINRNRVMSQTNIKQAMLPEGSIMIENPTGTACGFMVKVNKAVFIFLPGVPRELKAMWESSVKEIVLSLSEDTVPRTHLFKLFLMGIGESDLMEKIGSITVPQGVTIGDRAVYPLLELKIIGHNAADNDMLKVLEDVMKVVEPYYVSKDTFDLISNLRQQKISIGPVNAIDGVCRGYLLISLQTLFNDFVTCSVINTDLHDPEALKETTEVREHMPHNNLVSLMPLSEKRAKEIGSVACDLMQSTEFPYIFELSFDLEVEQNGKSRRVGATYLICSKDNIRHNGTYSRNRDFVSLLCCVLIYKTLMKEPHVEPFDMLVSRVNHYDA